ncbi:hypothetical protein ONZ45_g16650 [Pleurotus djamor]|nr:hypothetical protein ONZ45_g16650 [Pleurotus djamor]
MADVDPLVIEEMSWLNTGIDADIPIPVSPMTDPTAGLEEPDNYYKVKPNSNPFFVRTKTVPNSEFNGGYTLTADVHTSLNNPAKAPKVSTANFSDPRAANLTVGSQ